MNWQMIGALGEVGGSIAVFVTLFYLARQVRNSSRQERWTQYVELQRDANKMTEAISRDPVLAEVFIRGLRDLGSLNPVDHARFSSLLLTFFRANETLFHYHRERGLDDWASRASRPGWVTMLGAPGIQSWWADRRGWFSEAFQAEIDASISENSEHLVRLLETIDTRSVGGDAL